MSQPVACARRNSQCLVHFAGAFAIVESRAEESVTIDDIYDRELITGTELLRTLVKEELERVKAGRLAPTAGDIPEMK